MDTSHTCCMEDYRTLLFQKTQKDKVPDAKYPVWGETMDGKLSNCVSGRADATLLTEIGVEFHYEPKTDETQVFVPARPREYHLHLCVDAGLVLSLAVTAWYGALTLKYMML